MLELPGFLAIQSKYNNSYLQYVVDGEGEGEAGRLHQFLQFGGDNFVSPQTEFRIETAMCDATLVHLKCCYNNRYLARKPDADWIVAGAEKAQENRREWSCTLFKPVFIEGDRRTIVLLHVQSKRASQQISLGVLPSLDVMQPPYNHCLLLGKEESSPGFSLKEDETPGYIFTVIPRESAPFVLPRFVAFKDADARYLAPHVSRSRTYLHFVSANISDEKVWNEVYYSNGGSIRIRSLSLNKFWRTVTTPHGHRKTTWICPDVDPGDTARDNSDAVFRPIKINDKAIALFNLGKKLYCEVIPKKEDPRLAAASSNSQSKQTHLQVEECVKSRRIFDVHYHLDEVKIYNVSTVTLASQSTANDTGEQVNLGCKFATKISSQTSWKTSASRKVGGKVNITAGIPVIKGKVEIQGELKGTYEWGKTEVSSYDLESSLTTTVEKDHKVTILATANLGSCDVPFSYTQHDILPDGTETTSRMHDGICTSRNYYDFNFKTQRVRLLIPSRI